MKAKVVETKDLKYKGGYIQCACGWRKELGNGFNGYHLESCPDCDKAIRVYTSRKTCSGRPSSLTIRAGTFWRFVLSNGIDAIYKESVIRTYYGKTERFYDRL